MFYIDHAVSKNCYNMVETYGELCVGCGCCRGTELEKAKARLRLHKRRLEELKNFEYWDDEIRELQEKNINADIEYNEERIRYYSNVIRREERGKKRVRTVGGGTADVLSEGETTTE